MNWSSHNRRPQLPSSCPPGFEGSKRYVSRAEAAAAIKRQSRQPAKSRRPAKHSPPERKQPEPPPIVRCPYCNQYDQLHVHRERSSNGQPLFLLGCNRCNEAIRYVPAETAARIENLAGG